MGVASLVLGIIAIVVDVFTIGVYGWIGAILGLIGTILGAIGHKNQANGGLVCSIIGLVLGLLLYIACVACVASAGLL